MKPIARRPTVEPRRTTDPAKPGPPRAATLPNWRKLANEEPAVEAMPEKQRDANVGSATMGARAGEAEGKAGPATPAKRKAEENEQLQDAREGHKPTAADHEARLGDIERDPRAR